MNEVGELEQYLAEVIEELGKRQKKLRVLEEEIAELKAQVSRAQSMDVVTMKNNELHRKEMKQAMAQKEREREILIEDVQSAEERKSAIENELRMLKRG